MSYDTFSLYAPETEAETILFEEAVREMAEAINNLSDPKEFRQFVATWGQHYRKLGGTDTAVREKVWAVWYNIHGKEKSL